MRWAIGRLLLATAAVLPLSGAFWIQPAHAAGPGPLVLKCGRFRGVMDVSPGFSDVPANQTISAQGRVDRCHGAGGGGTFRASLSLTGATCGARRFEGAPGEAQFVWADGRSSTSSLTLVPSAVNPSKAEVYGTITSGAFVGTALRSGMRMTDSFTGSGSKCGAGDVVRRMAFTNYHCFMLYEPRTTTTRVRPTSVPHRAALVRQVVRPRTTAAPSGRIGSLALTGSNSGGALVGLGSLVVGGTIWALGGRGRNPDTARTTRRRRRARRWLYVTLPGDPT